MPDPDAIGSYLGDGVHASFDPQTNKISLLIQHEHPALQIPNVKYVDRVALSPEVIDALVEFACRCWPQETA
jgi:hypothetical protein